MSTIALVALGEKAEADKIILFLILNQVNL
jgi:hypothetical protein